MCKKTMVNFEVEDADNNQVSAGGRASWGP